MYATLITITLYFYNCTVWNTNNSSCIKFCTLSLYIMFEAMVSDKYQIVCLISLTTPLFVIKVQRAKMFGICFTYSGYEHKIHIRRPTCPNLDIYGMGVHIVGKVPPHSILDPRLELQYAKTVIPSSVSFCISPTYQQKPGASGLLAYQVTINRPE